MDISIKDAGATPLKSFLSSLEEAISGRVPGDFNQTILNTNVNALLTEVYGWKDCDGVRGDVWSLAFSAQDALDVSARTGAHPSWARMIATRLILAAADLAWKLPSAVLMDLPVSAVVQSERSDVFEGVPDMVLETLTKLANDLEGTFSEALETAEALES